MEYQVYPSLVPPAISRFAAVRAGWLGQIASLGAQRRRTIRQRWKPKAKKRRRVMFRWSAFRRPSFLSVPMRWFSSATARVARLVLNAVIILSLVGGTVVYGPRVFFGLFPQAAQTVQAEELSGDFALTVSEQEVVERKKNTPTERRYQPPYNENLPEGDWLVIPRIGVRSTLQQTEYYEDALNTGVWLAPDFGKPGDRNMPMIVAGHRFGFKWWWEGDYWKYHSFYLLPDLEKGDTVEVISGQRKYVYEIYDGEEGTEITDYQADLIIYTCKHLDSPIRIFRYARLLLLEGASPLEELQQ